MKTLPSMRACRKPPAAPFLFLCAFVAPLLGCAIPATYEGMIPASFETTRRIPHAVQVSVSGGDNSGTVGKPQITDPAFTRALVESIERSQLFSRVVDGRSQPAVYLLSVTLFSTDKRTFGRTVKLEAGWTLRRADTKSLVWQEAIISEFTDANIQVATEGAARNNIAQGLLKISRIANANGLD